MFAMRFVRKGVLLLTRLGGMLRRNARDLATPEPAPGAETRARHRRGDGSPCVVDPTTPGSAIAPDDLRWTALDDLQLSRLLKESSP